MYKHFGRSAFLISRPLQLMISLCIAKHDKFESRPVFIIVDDFCGALKVSEKLHSEFVELQTPIYFASRKLALNFLNQEKFDSIFIDGDVGVKNFLSLFLLKSRSSKTKIHVFEEGLGTYRTDLYSGVKKIIFPLVGIGIFFGGCRFVSNVYVYHVKEYQDEIPTNAFKAREIECSLFKFIKKNKSAFNRLFELEEFIPKSENFERCSLYLSSWDVDEVFLSEFKQLKGDLIIKLHPHIRKSIIMSGIAVVDSQTPAELVLLELISRYNHVHVYHHNTSTARYINASNLTYILIDPRKAVQ